MSGLLGQLDELAIVQIGANDGLHADPLFSFVDEYSERTRLLLVEPQPELIKYLEATYSSHPNRTVANCAVGPDGVLELFTVDPDCWSDCVVPYAAGWPEYRAPTGVASSDRKHVEAWVERFYEGDRSVEEVVKSTSVPCLPLARLVLTAKFGSRVDVLQVDAEGQDDHVIYESSIEVFRPAILNFEHVHLPGDRLMALDDYLRSQSYRLFRDQRNTMALRLVPNDQVPAAEHPTT